MKDDEISRFLQSPCTVAQNVLLHLLGLLHDNSIVLALAFESWQLIRRGRLLPTIYLPESRNVPCPDALN